MIGYVVLYLSRCQIVLVDGSYAGEVFVNGVKVLLGVGVEVVARSELHRFVVLAKCWVVECLFGWLEDYRLLWKSCERKISSTLRVTRLAFISLLLRRY
jgi:transposase